MAARIGTCVCGQLSVAVTGDPSGVYACSCKSCQRGSGSVFSYAAVYPIAAMSVSGEHKAYRYTSDSGRWGEGHFCPTCGTNVFTLLEIQPDDVAISVGCFADASFEPPSLLCWASRRHAWLKMPDGTELLDTQPE